MSQVNERSGSSRLEDKVYGCLLGGLIGDAMGAPVEGMSWREIDARYGPDGVTEFEGAGTDDTAIREQLIQALLEHGGHITCDDFATTFLESRGRNYGQWWVPVRNMLHKLESGVTLPVDAGWGNAPSSSSAMAISPVGIVNAGHPRQAAREAFDIAGLLHGGPSGFCRDAASAMAAAVAEAFRCPGYAAGCEARIDFAARAYLHAASSRQMIECIERARRLASEAGSYEAFRERCYMEMLREVLCDSRETVPVALAIFEMSASDPEQAIRNAVNFGRDADTIGTMVGGLAGALHGASGLPRRWVEKAEATAGERYRTMAVGMADLVRARAREATALAALVAELD